MGILHRLYTSFPHGGYILLWLCLGNRFPGKGSSQCKGPEVIGVGNVRAVSRLAGVLWLVDKGRQQEGGGVVRGLWGDRAGGQMLLDALAHVASQLPSVMHANGFLPVPSGVFLATGASPGCSRVPQESQRVG